MTETLEKIPRSLIMFIYTSPPSVKRNREFP